MQRHNFSFRADGDTARSSSRDRLHSPRFNKENQRPAPTDGKLERLLIHNQQLLVENEKLAIRTGEIQLLRQSNTELERSNAHLRESLRIASVELHCQRGQYEKGKAQQETVQLKLKNDMVMLAGKLDQAETLCKAHEAAMVGYRQQEERRLTLMAERLSKLQQCVGEHQTTIATLRRDKEHIERLLQQQRSQFKYETKRLEEQQAHQRASFERQLSILRQELQKKQLELAYFEKLSQEEAKAKEQQLVRISDMLKEKQQEELQAIQIIRLLQSEKDKAVGDYQQLVEKLRSLQKSMQEQYQSRAKELQHAFESRIDNYKRQNKQLQRSNRELKQSLQEKVDDAEEMRETLEQMSEFVRQLKRKCQQLYEKHRGLEMNFEERLEAERSKLRRSFEMMMDSHRKDERARQALKQLQPINKANKQFLSPGSSHSESEPPNDDGSDRQALSPSDGGS